MSESTPENVSIDEDAHPAGQADIAAAGGSAEADDLDLRFDNAALAENDRFFAEDEGTKAGTGES